MSETLEEEEVCLIRIKEQVGQKRSAVCTHGYALCLLKNTSTKYNKYGVNQKHEHVDDISFRELFGRIRVVFFQNKICPFLTQGICIYVGHSFFMKHSWTNSFNLSFSLEWEILVQRVKKSNVLMLLQEERGLDCMYSNRSLEVFRIHT